MRISLIILLGLLGLQAAAQQFEITGLLRDAQSKAPLVGGHVTLESGQGATVSDAEGQFSFTLDQSLEVPVQIMCQIIGYESRDVRLIPAEMTATGEGYFVAIDLKPKSYELDPVPVPAERLPDIVYASEQHSIADYEFLGDQLVLLAYAKRLEKASELILLDAQGQVSDSVSLPASTKAIGLERDYANQVYLRAERAMYLIELSAERIVLHKVDIQAYREHVEPIVDTMGTDVFFSTWIDAFPAFDYYKYNQVDSQYTKLHRVADAFMLELCRAEFKYLTGRDKLKMYRLERQTGMEKEVLTCMAAYKDGLYYDPLYAPLFTKGDSLLLFDHPAEQLFIFNRQGEPLDSVAIGYHQLSKVMGNEFTQTLVMDQERGEVFAVFQRAGGACWLERVDLATGVTTRTQRFHYDYPREIQVRDGEVYYTYRPFESSQKKYLYTEEIRY